jgi:hypothetical protein
MHEQLPANVQALLRKSQQLYQQHARLILSVDTLVTGKVAWCSAYQNAPAVNGTVLTEAEILDRANEAFAPLRTAGYSPIISVCEYGKGTPAKPALKHRVTHGLVVGGQRAILLRQAPPRMLFVAGGGTLHCLVAEVDITEQKTALLVKKAMAWWKRIRYRRWSAPQ